MKAVYVAMMAAAGVLIGGQAQAQDAAALAKAKNCLACHAVDKKLVGPAYKDVEMCIRDRNQGDYSSQQAVGPARCAGGAA